MCSQSQISDFMQEVHDEKADSVRALLLEYGASAEYLDTVTIDFKKPHDDPGMGANSRLSLHLVVPDDSTQPKVLNVRGGKGWVDIWKQLGDGSLACAPPGNLIRSPLFLDLSVDPAVDITIYPTLKDDEKKEPKPKPLDYTDKALSSLDDMPESFTSLGKASSTAGAHDVGIIPNQANDCPPGSEYVLIHTDDEDNNNNSNTSGWTGAITSDPRHHVRLLPRRREPVPGHSLYVVCRPEAGQLLPVGLLRRIAPLRQREPQHPQLHPGQLLADHLLQWIREPRPG